MSDHSRIVEAFNNRLSIYRQKRDAAKPFAADIYNRQEALQYVIDAIELLAFEAGLGSAVPAERRDD